MSSYGDLLSETETELTLIRDNKLLRLLQLLIYRPNKKNQESSSRFINKRGSLIRGFAYSRGL